MAKVLLLLKGKMRFTVIKKSRWSIISVLTVLVMDFESLL